LSFSLLSIKSNSSSPDNPFRTGLLLTSDWLNLDHSDLLVWYKYKDSPLLLIHSILSKKQGVPPPVDITAILPLCFWRYSCSSFLKLSSPCALKYSGIDIPIFSTIS